MGLGFGFFFFFCMLLLASFQSRLSLQYCVEMGKLVGKDDLKLLTVGSEACASELLHTLEEAACSSEGIFKLPFSIRFSTFRILKTQLCQTARHTLVLTCHLASEPQNSIVSAKERGFEEWGEENKMRLWPQRAW